MGGDMIIFVAEGQRRIGAASSYRGKGDGENKGWGRIEDGKVKALPPVPAENGVCTSFLMEAFEGRCLHRCCDSRFSASANGGP